MASDDSELRARGLAADGVGLRGSRR